MQCPWPGPRPLAAGQLMQIVKDSIKGRDMRLVNVNGNRQASVAGSLTGWVRAGWVEGGRNARVWGEGTGGHLGLKCEKSGYLGQG